MHSTQHTAHNPQHNTHSTHSTQHPPEQSAAASRVCLAGRDQLGVEDLVVSCEPLLRHELGVLVVVVVVEVVRREEGRGGMKCGYGE